MRPPTSPKTSNNLGYVLFWVNSCSDNAIVTSTIESPVVKTSGLSWLKIADWSYFIYFSFLIWFNPSKPKISSSVSIFITWKNEWTSWKRVAPTVAETSLPLNVTGESYIWGVKSTSSILKVTNVCVNRAFTSSIGAQKGRLTQGKNFTK